MRSENAARQTSHCHAHVLTRCCVIASTILDVVPVSVRRSAAALAAVAVALDAAGARAVVLDAGAAPGEGEAGAEEAARAADGASDENCSAAAAIETSDIVRAVAQSKFPIGHQDNTWMRACMGLRPR